MSISLTITRDLNGAQVVYQFVADTISKADEMARFLAGATMQPLPAVTATELNRDKGATVASNEKSNAAQADGTANTDSNAKEEAKTEKEPEAKKPQLSGTASTQTSPPEASDTSKGTDWAKMDAEKDARDNAKAYGYEEVKTLIVQVLKDKGRDTAAACLARVGLKVLPKDCKDASLLADLGALASGVLAGSVDVFESVEA